MSKWKLFKHKLLQLLGGLVLEDRGDGVYIVSLGRVSFWLVFIPALFVWYSAINNTGSVGVLMANQTLKDPPAGMLNILMFLLSYNITKHISSTVKNVWGSAVVPTITTSQTTNTVETH